MWQQLGLRANDLIQQDRSIEELISIIDNELSLVISSSRPQVRRRPMNARLHEFQDGSFQYEIYTEGNYPFQEGRSNFKIDSLKGERTSKALAMANSKTHGFSDSLSRKKESFR